MNQSIPTFPLLGEPRVGANEPSVPARGEPTDPFIDLLRADLFLTTSVWMANR